LTRVLAPATTGPLVVNPDAPGALVAADSRRELAEDG